MNLKNQKKKPADPLEKLREKLSTLAQEAASIEAAAASEDRELTEEETERLGEITSSFDATEKEIETRSKVADMTAKAATPQRRLAVPVIEEETEEVEASTRAPITGNPVGATKGNWGFVKGVGEWAIAARKQALFSKVDNRIMNAPASYGAEGVNTDGGFAVPPDFRANIMKFVESEQSLLGQCDQVVTSSNAVSMPFDSTTPWASSGGIIGQWIGEGQSFTPQKPSFKMLNCKAHKLGVLVALSDELVEDVPAMTAYLNSKVPDKFNAMVNTAIVAGTGAGQPQGLLNSPAKITQAAEAAQGAGTVVAKNVLKMWSRMYGPWRAGAVWLINQDVEQQLQQLTMPGTNPSQAAYMPPGGFANSPFATLLGRPIYDLEACSALGTEGDIVLVNLKQYLAVVKGGMRQDASIHMYFDSDHMAFRFVLRLGGQAYLDAPIARQSGSSTTLSSIVTLNSTRT